MLTKCIWCNKKPIHAKLKMTCKECQYLIRKYGIPKKKQSVIRKPYYTPVPNDITYRRGKTIKSLIYKHGAKILSDFVDLSNKPFYSLADFADKYGFTREYARQIHFKLIGKNFQEIAMKKTKMVNNIDIACKNNPLYKIAEHKKSSNSRQGALIEQKFIEMCEKRNLDVEIPCNTVADLKVNGFNVEVKSNGKSKLIGKAKTKRYMFYIRSSQIEKVDFVACYHNRLDAFFIIPKKEISVGSFGKGGNISFSVNKTNHWCSKNRYWEFKDAWNLLSPA